ncbi:hypothetical protein ARMGADRAFT_1076028 [Armillaria gallica]|uniref:CCHC-type domain-containing protein n=1 Tax=Armillaria gallica TaxID=47427 RepID=A0A2H3E1J4_ARMGA|nr:hypothetical protein ARMGADRAFT_1076028 [Armillaria gallica]
MNINAIGSKGNAVKKAEPGHNKANPGENRKQKVIICFQCGQEGHIATNTRCLEASKKPLYAQMRAAHSIIPDAMAETVGAEDHLEDGDETGGETYDTVEMEFYDQENESDDGDRTEDEHFNWMHVHTPQLVEEDEDTEDEVVYGNPMAEHRESLRTIPLFKFGGLIPDVVLISSHTL